MLEAIWRFEMIVYCWNEDVYALFLLSRNRGNQFGRFERGIGSSGKVKIDFLVLLEGIPFIHVHEWYGIGKRNEILALRGAFLKPCNDLERGIPQAL
ncbi:hypothetical protein V6N13_113606 [Hibiscus sabdariffa]